MSERVKIIVIKNVELKKLRKKAKLSLRKLAELSGVNFTHISKCENGLIMSSEVWEKIVKVLDRKLK